MLTGFPNNPGYEIHSPVFSSKLDSIDEIPKLNHNILLLYFLSYFSKRRIGKQVSEKWLKFWLVTKISAGFYYCRLFLYRLSFLLTIINADFFTYNYSDFLCPCINTDIKSHKYPEPPKKWINTKYCYYRNAAGLTIAIPARKWSYLAFPPNTRQIPPTQCQNQEVIFATSTTLHLILIDQHQVRQLVKWSGWGHGMYVVAVNSPLCVFACVLL